MKPLLLPFVGLAAIGLALSLAVHLCALLGQPIALGHRVWFLHLGIFAVWIPTVIIGSLASRDTSRKDFWKVALRGCPDWFRFLLYGLFAYALVNFAIFVWRAMNVPRGERLSDEVGLIGFSGHWMVFYAASLGVLWSFAKVGRAQASQCPNGHATSAGAKFCPECGCPMRSDRDRA